MVDDGYGWQIHLFNHPWFYRLHGDLPSNGVDNDMNLYMLTTDLADCFLAPLIFVDCNFPIIDLGLFSLDHHFRLLKIWNYSWKLGTIITLEEREPQPFAVQIWQCDIQIYTNSCCAILLFLSSWPSAPRRVNGEQSPQCHWRACSPHPLLPCGSVTLHNVCVW